MKFRCAEIGITLVACNVPAFVDLIALSFNMWNFYITWQIWANPMIACGLFVLTIVGLALYIMERKEFVNRAKGNKFVSVMLLIISLTLIVGSGLQSMFTVVSFRAYTERTSGWYPLTLEEAAIYIMYFVWSGLAFISGVLWLVDGVTISSKTDLLPLKQKTELESQTKYPKDLPAGYRKQYHKIQRESRMTSTQENKQ